MTEIERFRDAVERHIEATGISPTKFGRVFASDPLFVFQLREGREPRSDTRQRVLAAIQSSEDASRRPAPKHEGAGA